MSGRFSAPSKDEFSSQRTAAPRPRSRRRHPRRIYGTLLPVELLEPRFLLSAVSSLRANPDLVISDASNVVLVDNTVAQSGLLVSAARSGDKIFSYDGARDAPKGILEEVYSWAKAQGVSVASLSILAHGQPGAFRLGDAWISPATLALTASSWKQLDQVLAPSATIDLYGCNVAAPGGSGQTLINRIARLTGASVFASTNLTGRGGDWILEAESTAHRPQVSPNTSRVFSLGALAAYPDSLATITVATAATASPSPVTGTTTNLSVLGASTSGESTLIYTWSATTSPGTVTYSANGTNASKNTTATFVKAGNYVFKVTISDSLGSTSATSTVNVTVSQTFTSMTMTASASSIHELATKTITTKGYDQFGVVMSPEPTWTWSMVSGAGSVASASATTGKYTAGSVAGTSVVQAANGSLSKTVSITVINASPTVATAAAITPKPATGTTAALSVLGADDNGEANLTYTWAATTKPAGSNPTFSANGTNASKNCTVSFNASGSYTFTATINDGQGGTVTSAVTETVNQTLTTITVTPSNATLAVGNTQQFTATGYDQFGIVMATQPTFTWSVNTGGAGGTISASGLYTAPASVGSGSDVVKAVSGAVSGTAAVTVTNASLPATASPSTVTGTTTSLSALWSGDTGQSNLTYTWSTIGSPPAPVTFSANGTNGAKNTTATFTKSGSYTIQVSILYGSTNEGTSSTTVTVNQTFSSIAITPATANLNLNQTQGFSGSGLDQFGNAMASQPTLTWSLENGSVGSFNTATLVYSSGGSAGNATVRATSGSVASSAVVVVTEAPPTVATAAAANPSPATGLTTNLTVLGASSGGESNLTYTWSTTGSPPAPVTFSDSGDNAAKNVTATFTVAGTYNFLATITDASNNSVTSAVAVVVSQTVTTIAISPGSVSLGATGTQAFSAAASDQFGNVMSPEPTFTWSATSGSIDQSGNYTAPQTSATPTITASSGGISGMASATVTNAAPTVATAASATPATVTGTTTALSVLGADDGGESNLTYTWATTGTPPATVSFSANGTNAAKNSTATFAKAGTYGFQVTITDAGGLSTTSSIGVTVNQTLTTISVSPATASLNENQTQQFTATGYDQFGNAMASQPTFSWAKASGVGSINSSGLYTAPYGTGSASITATSASVSGAASISVANAAPTIATAASATPNPVADTTTALSVLGADDGGESNLTYTWATTGTPPASVSFSSNDTNAAKNTTVTFTNSGIYNFQVTATDAGGLSTTSSVSVTVNQTLTTITAVPGSSSLNENQTQQFSATAYDQFGITMASQPSFNWSLVSGVGSINSSGLYLAPWATGSATIEAASGQVSGTASITVASAPLTAPSNLTATASSSSSVALNWQDTDAFATGAAILRSVDGGSFSTLATLDPTSSASIVGIDFLDGSGDAGTATLNCVPSGLGDGSLWAIGGSLTITASSDAADVPLGTYPLIPNSTASLNGSNSPTGAFQIDNLVYPSNNAGIGSSILTEDGLLFGKGNGAIEINIWGNGGGDYAFYAGYNSSSYPIAVGSGATVPHLATFSAATSYTDSTVISGHTYTYEVVALNSGASSPPSLPAQVTIAKTNPVVVTPAAANPSPVTGTTTALSVLGGDDNGEANLTYTWTTTGTPPANVVFSDNGDNSAKDITATFAAPGSYDFQVTITNAWGLSTTSSLNVTVDQTLTTIAVSPGTSSLSENQTQQFSAVAYDQFGTAMSSQPTINWSKAAGVGSVSSSGLYTAPFGTGTASIEATDGSVSGAAAVTVTNAPPTVATAASASPSPVAGTTTVLSVLGADDGGESNLTYAWSTTGTPPAAVSFSANGTNASKNTTATFTKAGTYNFQVTITDAGGLNVTSSVSVTVGQTLTTILVSPGSASLNENATQTFSAVGYDQFGDAMSSQPTFTWSKAAGIGLISGSGVYTSPGSSGTATIAAGSGGVSGIANVTITNAPPTVATPASASPLPVIGTTAALSVLGADDGGEANLTYTWMATAEPTGANPAFSANGTNAAKGSTVTFDEAGNYTFTATISDGQGGTIDSSVNVTVNQTLTTISVLPSTSSLNENQTQQFTAAGYDQFGALMSSQPTFAWSKTSGIGSISSSGVYSSPGSSGTATIMAGSEGVSSTASVTISNASPTIANPASASPSPVTGTTTMLSSLGADDGGESNLTYTWSATSEPSGANPTFSDNGTNSAKNSTVTFDESGDYTFKVTISDGQGGTANSSVTVSVVQTLTTITVSPHSTSLNENATRQFAAVGYDQFATAMAAQPAFSWSSTGIGNIDAATGVYTSPDESGMATVSAGSGSISGTASVTITNESPVVVTAAAAIPSPVTGTTTVLSVLGADDGGEANLTYTWAAITEPIGSNPAFSANGTNSSKTTLVTFDEAGNYAFAVTISDGQGGTTQSSVNVTVAQTLTTATLSPGSASLNENATQQFTAAGYDQFDHPMMIQPTFTWSKTAGIGSISGSGDYTSPGSSGTATIAASSGSITSTANVTVTNAAPTVATPASASPSPVTGKTTLLRVLGADDGGESNLTYTWAAAIGPIGANPTFSDNATNSAKSTTVTFDETGSYTFTVTISDGQGGTTSSSVNVTVNQTLTSITVSPISISLTENATQSFSAVPSDQFGEPMASPTAFTWSNTGIGTIDPSTGFYTAPATAGNTTITATSGSISGSATLVVTNAAPTVLSAAAATPSPVPGTTTALSVLAADDGGEPNLTYTWAATAEPAGAQPAFSDNATNSAKDSTVTFDRAGNYTFTVTISDGQGGITHSSVNVVVDQTLTGLTILPATSFLNENATQGFSADGYDQFGRTMVAQPTVTWSNTGVGSVDAITGVYTSPGTSGAATITATSGTVTGTATIEVSEAVPTIAVPAAATDSVVTGNSVALSVLGADEGGEGNLTYTWAVVSQPTGAPPPAFSSNGTNSAKDTTASFFSAGTYVFRVMVSDGSLSAFSSVTVRVAPTLIQIVVTPADETVAIGSVQQISFTGYDQFGAVMATPSAVTWAVQSGKGSINNSGRFTAPATAETETVTATAGGVTGSANIIVFNQSTAVASPATVTGTSTLLSVVGASGSGLTYSWSTVSKPDGASDPRFSENDSLAAQGTTVKFAQAGEYILCVAISDGTTRTIDTVTVAVLATARSVKITPPSAAVASNGTVRLVATAYDQFGLPLALQPAFTWTLSGGIGGITPDGEFTAGDSVGSATVMVTAGSLHGSAGMSVNLPSLAVAGFSASPVSVPVWLAPESTESVLAKNLGDSTNEPSTIIATFAPVVPFQFLSTSTNLIGTGDIAAFTAELAAGSFSISRAEFSPHAAGESASVVSGGAPPQAAANSPDNSPRDSAKSPTIEDRVSASRILKNTDNGIASASPATANAPACAAPRTTRSKLWMYVARALDGCIAIGAAALAAYLLAAKITGINLENLNPRYQSPPPD